MWLGIPKIDETFWKLANPKLSYRLALIDFPTDLFHRKGAASLAEKSAQGAPPGVGGEVVGWVFVRRNYASLNYRSSHSTSETCPAAAFRWVIHFLLRSNPCLPYFCGHYPFTTSLLPTAVVTVRGWVLHDDTVEQGDERGPTVSALRFMIKQNISSFIPVLIRFQVFSASSPTTPTSSSECR